jgi:hypothetical protein
MLPKTLEKEFRSRVGEKISIAPEGLDRYRVFTPFLFDDGDHLAIVLKHDQGRWVLSDEGHTYMHLTYDLDEKDLQKGTRSRIIQRALSAFAVDDREGELVLPVPDDRFGDALYNFVQALLKVTDVGFLSREHVRSTFLDDFRSLLERVLPEGRREFCWHDPQHDPEGKYVVDCRVSGRRPLLCFALQNDDRVRDATIALLQFERWGLDLRSVAVFQNQEDINRKVLARFSDVCEKQFSSLVANKDRLERYLSEASAS